MTNPTTLLAPQNGFSTSLSAPMTITDTVAYLSALPTATEGYLTVDEGLATQEVFFYNAKGSNFVTIPSLGDRGLQGSTAGISAHSGNASVKMKTVAQYLKAIQDGYAISPRTSTLVNPYKFSAYRSSNTTAAVGLSKIQLDAETYDTGGNYDNATNFRFIAPVAGFYHFEGNINFSGNSGNLFQAYLYKNGSAVKQGQGLVTSNAFQQGVAVSGTIQLAATDYVELWFNNGAGVAETIVGTAATTYLDGFLISAT